VGVVPSPEAVPVITEGPLQPDGEKNKAGSQAEKPGEIDTARGMLHVAEKGGPVLSQTLRWSGVITTALLLVAIKLSMND
jgi:hypothetical protein